MIEFVNLLIHTVTVTVAFTRLNLVLAVLLNRTCVYFIGDLTITMVALREVLNLVTVHLRSPVTRQNIANRVQTMPLVWILIQYKQTMPRI